MKGLFTRERVNVAQALDLVEWTLGDRKIRLYYPTCFKIAGGLRVAGKAGVDAAGGNVSLWRELAKYKLEAPFNRVHHEYRRSGFLSNLEAWHIDVEGELVVAYLDDLVAKFHCTDALIFQAWLDVAARQAKAWAGDDYDGLILTARLTNATPDRAYSRSLPSANLRL